MKLNKCHFFSKEIQYLGHILSTKGICPLPLKTQAIQKMHPLTTTSETSLSLPWISWVLQEIYQGFHQNNKTIDPPHLTAIDNLNGPQHIMQPSWN